MGRSYNIRKYGLKLSVAEITAALANGLGINQQDMNGCTLLHYAAEDAKDKYDRLAIVTYLLANGADPDLHSHSIHGKGNGPSPIQLALQNGRSDLADLMREKSVDTQH